jgi:acetyl esterase/lipase
VAASTVLRSRRHLPIAFQLLDVPALDDRLDTDSARRSTATPGLTRAGMRAAWAAYLHGAASGDAVPARTHDLAGLPPTYVATAQLDPLRDEGIAYAQRLMAAGIRVELHCLPGTFHGSEVVAPTAAVSRRAAELRLRALAAGLGVAVDDRVRASARL